MLYTNFALLSVSISYHTALRSHVCALSLSDVPEELLPDPEGSLMGGGRCFTPLPKTDVWTSGEIPSPCSWHLNQFVSHNTSHQCWITTAQPIRLNILYYSNQSYIILKKIIKKIKKSDKIKPLHVSWISCKTKMRSKCLSVSTQINHELFLHPSKAVLTSSLLGEGGPCPTLPELWDILTWHFTSLSYTPLYWLRNLWNKQHKMYTIVSNSIKKTTEYLTGLASR